MSIISPESIIFDNINIILVITIVIINSKTGSKYLEDVSIIDNIYNFRYHHSCFFDKSRVIFVSINDFSFIDKKLFLPAKIYEIPESKLKNMLPFNAKVSTIKIKEGSYNKSELITNILCQLK